MTVLRREDAVFVHHGDAVATHRGHVLLHRSAQDNLWSLPVEIAHIVNVEPAP